MYLRTLIGPYAGQVFDFSPEAASAMLADGRAVHPDADLEEDEAAAEALEAIVDGFATGGIVETEPVIVGERASDRVLPTAVAKKVAAVRRVKGQRQ